MKLSNYQQVILLYVSLKGKMSKKQIWHAFRDLKLREKYRREFYFYGSINRNINRLVDKKLLTEENSLVEPSIEGYKIAIQLAKDWTEYDELNQELVKSVEAKESELHEDKHI